MCDLFWARLWWWCTRCGEATELHQSFCTHIPDPQRNTSLARSKDRSLTTRRRWLHAHQTQSELLQTSAGGGSMVCWRERNIVLENYISHHFSVYPSLTDNKEDLSEGDNVLETQKHDPLPWPLGNSEKISREHKDDKVPS